MNESPTTQAGPLGSALEPWPRSKIAPMQRPPLRPGSTPVLKSRGSIDHDRPPKDIDMVTFVSQAERRHISEDEKRNRGWLHTVRITPLLRGFLRSRNRIVQRHNISLGSSDESSPCVDSGRSINSRECYCCTIDGETWQRLRTTDYILFRQITTYW